MSAAVVRVFDDKHGLDGLEHVAGQWVVHMVKDESLHREGGKQTTEASHRLGSVALRVKTANFEGGKMGTAGL